MIKLNKFSLGYIYVKLVKQAGSPDYIARGVAIGLMVGMVIPFGLQIPVAIVLAFILKAAKIPAFACTWVTNHITIFFIYPVQCWIGSYLIANPLSFEVIKEKLKVITHGPSWTSLIFKGQFSAGFETLWNQITTAFEALGGQIVASFFVGGFLFGIILAVPGYFFSLYWVKQYRKLKEKKLKRRQEKLKAAQTT